MSNDIPAVVRMADGRVHACSIQSDDEGRNVKLAFDNEDMPQGMKVYAPALVLKKDGAVNIEALKGIHCILRIECYEDGTSNQYHTTSLWTNHSPIHRDSTVMEDGSIISEDNLLENARGWHMKERPKDRILKGRTADEVENRLQRRRTENAQWLSRIRRDQRTAANSTSSPGSSSQASRTPTTSSE